MTNLFGLFSTIGLLIVTWGVCAIFTAMIAAIKGRSIMGWLLLGVVFGILAFVLVCALPARQKSMFPSGPGTINLEKQVKCEHCGNNNSAGRQYCQACGWQLSVPF
jgi:hypothetical protein